MSEHRTKRDRYLRPNDEDALRGAVRQLQRETGTAIAFGGRVEPRSLRLTQFVGTRTGLLKGLAVQPDAGLGGKCWTSSQVLAVDDYARARSITHEYDVPVMTEGIRSIVAAPVIVQGATRGIVYAAVREPAALGDRVKSAAAASARALARELETRDEVDRRLALMAFCSAEPVRGDDSVLRERLREAHADVRELITRVEDAELRERLEAIRRKLAFVDAPLSARQGGRGLSGREIDVLSLVALGCSYQEVARRLSLVPSTVKSYMQSVLQKLQVHSRHEAVVAARQQGLIP
jgi:LuxR family transcriptional regulator, regulator of acetate metabolism